MLIQCVAQRIGLVPHKNIELFGPREVEEGDSILLRGGQKDIETTEREFAEFADAHELVGSVGQLLSNVMALC